MIEGQLGDMQPQDQCSEGDQPHPGTEAEMSQWEPFQAGDFTENRTQTPRDGPHSPTVSPFHCHKIFLCCMLHLS